MKQPIFILSFLFCIGLMNAPLLAQSSQKCGEGPAEYSIIIRSSARLCYPKADYPTASAASQQLYNDILSTLDCDNSNCAIPSLFDCEAVLIDVLKRPTSSQDSSNWCFFDKVTITWKCTECTRIEKGKDKDKDTTDSEPEEHKSSLNHSDSKISYVDFSHLEPADAPATIHKVYPNPTSGILHLKLNVTVPDSKVVLTISDLTGKAIRQKEYSNVPSSLFHIQSDLSEQASGLYLMSVQVNGKLISTSKVNVQNPRS